MGKSTGPLQGVRAVTCSTAQAGTVPYMFMADLGAEIIKIEVLFPIRQQLKCSDF